MVTLDVPAGALPTSSIIQHVERAPIYTRSLVYVFDLTARQVSTGLSVDAFAKPLTLTIHYDSLWNRLSGGIPALFTFNAQTQRWERVDAVNNYESRTLTAAILHFSTWALGQFTGLDQRYLPSMNGFGEDPFMGGATINYPLEMPAFPGNVMPPLSLAYSSSSAADARRNDDTLMAGRQTSFVGAAWSLNGLPKINRDVRPATRWFATTVPYDKYYLSSPAGSGRIVQWPAASGGDDYWHILNESYVRLSRLNGESQWLMTDKNGTQYRFDNYGDYKYPGFIVYPGTLNLASNCGALPSYPNMWYVAAITDTHQNVATIDYATQTRRVDYKCDDDGGAGSRGRSYTTINAVYPVTITVNNMRAVTFQYETKPDKDINWCGGDGDTNHGQDPWNQPMCTYQRLSSIQIWANGTIVRSYALTYDTAANKTRLTGISLRGVGDATGVPANTFAYGTSGDDNQFIVTGTNGYGGNVEWHYGQETIVSYCNDPAVCHADGSSKYWAVMTKTVSSVAPSASYMTTWAYSGLTMQSNDIGFDPKTNYTPADYDSLSIPEEAGNNVLGHAIVTQTVYASGIGSSVLNQSVARYHQRLADNKVDPRQGKLYEMRQLSPNGSVLLSTTATYSYVVLQDRSSMPVYDRNFIRLDESNAFTCEGSATCRQTRTTYAYDAYGNVTREYRAGDVNDVGDDSTIYRAFYPLTTTAYIVNRVARESIYSGYRASDDNDLSTLRARTRYHYDSNACFNVSPGTKGDLTAVDRWNGGTGGTACTTTGYDVTAMQYDTWGNPIVVTDTRGYATTTAYDSVYHILPLSVTNALGQQTVTQYDLTLQKPLTITDPNGAVTSIAYDAIGRRTSIWSPTEQGGAATAKLTYSEVPTTVVEAEGGYSGHLCGSAQSGSWLSPTPGTACYLTYGPYWAPVSAGFGQTAYFRLSIDTASGSNDNIVRIEVEDYTNNLTVIAQRILKRADFPGGLTNFRDFALPFDTSGRSGHQLEYRVWWYGAAQVAHDRTTINWALAPFVFKADVRTDAPGEATTYQATASVYNGLGQLVQSQSASDTSGQIIVTNQRYNALGKVEAASVPTSVVGTMGTFVSGEWAAIDSRPRTATAYDALGRTTVITAPDGTRTAHYYGLDTDNSLGYTPTGLLWHGINDPNSHAKHEVMDALGRTVLVREFTGTCYGSCQLGTRYYVYAETRYGYDILGNLRVVTDTLGNTTVITYDSLGRKTAMSDPDMGVWSYAYDSAGNLTSQIDAKGQAITFTYDSLNRLTRKTYPVGSGLAPITYTYDTGTNGVGNRTRMDDAMGYTTWVYDPRGRVTRETKSVTGVGVFTTGTTYDAADRVRTLTYPTGEVVTQTYDARGLFSTLAGGTPYVSQTTYNVLGQVTAQTFGNSVTTNYGYNTASYRLQQIQVGALMDLRYLYDQVGNVTAMTDMTNSNQDASFRYDALDRLTSAGTNAAGNGQYNETYAYDPIGNLTSKAGIEYAYKPETNWVDDAMPAGAVPLGEAWTWVSANPTPAFGALAHQSPVATGTHQHYFENATQTLAIGAGDRLFAYVYIDPANPPREVMLQWCATDGTCWDHRAYWGEDLIGWGIDGTASRQRMGDLPAASGWVRLEVPAYLVGLEGKTVNGMAFTVYDGRATWDRAGVVRANGGQPHAVTAVGAYTYTYDANGNMLTRGEWSGNWQQVWDADNRAVLMTNTTSGTWASFAYDGDGKRVKKVDNGITTTVYVGALFELNVTAGITSTYYFANGKRIAVRNGQGLSYLHSDQLGSHSASTSVTGTLIARLGYKPYGQTAWSTATLPAEFGYTGQRYDSGDGYIYDYGARFYDEYIGRFISADTIVPGAGNPQALNRYSYALGNPLKYIDPTGHWSEEELAKTLGDDWYDFYFGQEGIVKDRPKLLEFLRAKNIDDPANLKIVGELMWTMRRLSQVGMKYDGIDAIGVRITGSGGGAAMGGASVDVILNLYAGQLSYFVSPVLGVLAGASASSVGGIQFIADLKDNNGYRGAFGSIGGSLGGGPSGNAEYFWSGPVDDQFTLSAKGVFVGGGVGGGGGIYGDASYGLEVLRVDAAHGYVLQGGDLIWHDPLAAFRVARDMGLVLVHDIALNSHLPWSPYK